MRRIGVFVCHCGSNIAATVDIEKVVEAAKTFPGVVYAVDNKYTCSEPGQEAIKKAIKDYNLERVVICSCTPRMHENTFQKTIADAGLNPYVLEIANIREQCSWVHTDKEKATEKAISLCKMAVAKAARNEELFTTTIPIERRALVIGGGIAGMQAALDIADAGYPVTLVEREASIGGKMVMLDKTFPTLDCSACISTPKMVAVSQHPNIELMTSCEVTKVAGYIGNFDVTIKKKAIYVNHDACTGCGLCETKCPSKVDNEFDQNMGKRKAIHKMFAQAVPNKPIIDKESCIMLKSGKCGLCAKICPTGAINYEDQGEEVVKRFGAIVLATGYQLIDWTEYYGEYGGGRYDNIITGLQFERMVNASGPTEGKIVRPSDGKTPQSVLFVKCVGSRDAAKAKSYCSRACCMYTAKHAHQVLEKIPGAEVFVSYMDVRTPGKGYEEFYMKTLEDGAVYLRGRISKIYPEGEKLISLGEDTLANCNVTLTTDLVVLETAMEPAEGAESLAAMIGVGRDKDGWLQEAHPKLRPVETNAGGVFLAGTCQGPKDIPDTVAQASAAAVKVCGLLSKTEMETNPMISKVDPQKCCGCGFCKEVCPYGAIELVEIPDRVGAKKVMRTVSQVNPGLCQGCGACTVSCRVGAIDLLGFTNRQILEEVDAICR